MKIVLVSHPSFLGHQSMPRYTDMLYSGMTKRGHEVDILASEPTLSSRVRINALRKWVGYIDQYLLFPRILRSKVASYPSNTLFVVTDHALGPLVPAVSNRPHVIHCHDFLAQRSAKGQYPENRTQWTGRLYQSYIRNGYSSGRNFISVSEKTRRDLHEFIGHVPVVSEVIYNGLDPRYRHTNKAEARAYLQAQLGVDTSAGYIMHVGGNQWYKNRTGVIAIYNAWRNTTTLTLPLVLMGEVPDDSLRAAKERSPYSTSIHFVTNADDNMIRFGYSGARLFLFPSFGEGFGWPIAEAMACGCIVVTTNEAPMTEVGGKAARYIPRMPSDPTLRDKWEKEVARTVEHLTNLIETENEFIVSSGYENVTRFDLDQALDKIEQIYKRVLFEN